MEDLEAEGKRISRRGFLKGAGAFMLLGAAGTGRWNVLESLLRSGATTGGEPSSSTTVSGNNASSQFTIFWTTDTQYLSESNPTLYSQMTRWIVNSWKAFNGKLVVHTGDVVQTGAHLGEWVNANSAMKVLTDNGIPYVWCAGNHDDLVQNDPNSAWAGSQFDAFNPAVMSGKINDLGYTRWAGDYHDGMNTAVSFSANGLNFLVVGIEWNAPPDVLAWLEGLIDSEKYKEHYVVVAPHAYEDAFGSTNDQRWGPTLTDFRQHLRAILDAHRYNVFLTLNGHFATDSGYHTPVPINDRNQLMFDRQESTDDPRDPVDENVANALKVGGATVTLLTFDMARNAVSVKTFDPFEGEYRAAPMDEYSFVMLPYQSPRGIVPNLPAVH